MVVNMTMPAEHGCDHERISALVDGRLTKDEWVTVMPQLGTEDARSCWHLYHLVGDVLRSEELAACGHDQAFVARLSERLKQESVAPVPVADATPALPVTARPAANDGLFRWKMVAGVASFAAVAAIGWSAMSGIGAGQSGAQMAQRAPQTPVLSLAAAVPAEAASVSSAQIGPVMLRDARLDELLAAHRQAADGSALGSASGFLRNATFEGPGR